ncbi:RsmD family RNA methyltransferase [Vaginella massiliensis]|uniref:RsmD family RNA methyltransferase n=1 Tax=Vaginella massiliensis TaxID=1816680 RepID=UPI000838C903|nr:RsmD family RNA methyltransferase [Vaginella massiliensis]
MNSEILNPEFQQYLQSIEKENPQRFSLKKSPFSSISSAEIAQQVKGKQVAQHKFPSLYATPGIYYPPSVNLEQASSELTANYKATIVKGKKLIDLTAGFGIDCFAFAQNFGVVTHVEQNKELSQIVAANAKTLGLNIKCYHGTFQEYFIENSHEKFDCIYLDPARRDAGGRKFILEDLEPNILDYLDEYWQKTDQILLKLSPLLDISSTIHQLQHAKQIHIVAVKNEVKEMLVKLDKFYLGNNPEIVCINLKTKQDIFKYRFEDESVADINYTDSLHYIYSPNASILKAGAFKLVGKKFNLSKLHQNTHLYTSDLLIEEFPGKIYEVIKIITQPKKELLSMKVNSIAKNFNQPIDVLKKKYKLIDGGENTLIFCRTFSGFQIFLTKRIR